MEQGAIHSLEWKRFVELSENEARTARGKAALHELLDPAAWAPVFTAATAAAATGAAAAAADGAAGGTTAAAAFSISIGDHDNGLPNRSASRTDFRSLSISAAE